MKLSRQATIRFNIPVSFPENEGYAVGANTFSWEPCCERSLAPRQTISLWIDFEF